MKDKPSINQLKQHIIDNKHILEKIIRQEENKLKNIPPIDNFNILNVNEAKKAVQIGKESAEEICNYKLKKEPKVKIMYNKPTIIKNQILQASELIGAAYYSSDFVENLFQYTDKLNGTNILIITGLGLAALISQAKIYQIKSEENNFYIKTYHNNKQKIFIPLTILENTIIGSSHEYTHAIMDEINHFEEESQAYELFGEGAGRLIETITAENKFKEENNQNYLWTTNPLKIKELKNSQLKIRKNKMHQNWNLHELGSSISAIEFYKKGEQAIYDMLHLKIGKTK